MGDFAASDEELNAAIDESVVQAHLRTLFSDADRGLFAYSDDAVLVLPQLRQRHVGRDSIRAFRRNNPRRDLVGIECVVGKDDLWFAECTFADQGKRLIVAIIMQFDEGRIVQEREYWCPSASA